jgi:predicted dehydrogenase
VALDVGVIGVGMIGQFVDSVRTGAPVAVPVTDALGVALVVDACYRSEQAHGAGTPLAARA